MPRRLSYEKKQLMERWYAENLPIPEIARRAKVSYSTAYGYTKAKQRGFASRTAYKKHLAEQKGFASLSKYYKYLAKQRQQQPINQELSDLIKQRLKELNRDQSWLAREIGVTKQTVSLYAQGKSVPNEEVLSRLYSALGVPYQTLDDLLK